MGADIGSQTNHGGTVLWWAKQMLPEGHIVTEYLESIGAPDEHADGGDLDDEQEKLLESMLESI